MLSRKRFFRLNSTFNGVKGSESQPISHIVGIRIIDQIIRSFSVFGRKTFCN